MKGHLVVIGGTAAGMSAAAKARREAPTLPITVFERTGYISYGSCGLPYYIGGDIKDINELIAFTPEEMKKERNIDVKILHEVVEIDFKEKFVLVRDLTTDKFFKQPFSHLVIATGASPVIPPIDGIYSRNIFTLRNVEDGLRIKEYISSKKVSRAAILGAGFIGLELAEALRKQGLEVMIFEMLPDILPNFDSKLASVVKEELNKNSVKLFTNKKVVEFKATGKNGISIITESKETFEADMAIVSVGVKPNSLIAKRAGIKTGLKDGIVVDKYMQTNIPNVWAAGDCVISNHIITKKPVYVPLGTTANKQGRVAGENVAGGTAEFPGVLGTQITKIFDTHVAATGLSELLAKASGFETVSAVIKHRDKASYYSNSRPVWVKIIIDKDSAKILGAQIAGSEGAAKRIDVFVSAITAGLTVYELNDLDLAYAPPVSPVYDPVLIASSVGIKELKKALR